LSKHQQNMCALPLEGERARGWRKKDRKVESWRGEGGRGVVEG
jgi:hypothetical protein